MQFISYTFLHYSLKMLSNRFEICISQILHTGSEVMEIDTFFNFVRFCTSQQTFKVLRESCLES